MEPLAADCLAANAWICGEYVTSRATELRLATVQHLQLVAQSVALALVVSLLLAVAVRRSRTATAALLGASSTLYAVPSLALFGLLIPVTGITAATVVIGLVLYSLTILVRNVLTGLDDVPRDTVEAARGMGMSARRVLLTVELPLAAPAILTGLRIATVSATALVTVGALIGYGGLGNLIYSGLANYFKAEVFTASVVTVALALALDGLLLLAQRSVTPWLQAVPA